MMRLDAEPRHFGPPDSPLFGSYHAPRGKARPDGVVLCYPFGQEYERAHRAFRTLASRLSGAGFHVLRFDYHGCGDSSGERVEGRLQRWVDDIITAMDELRNRAGVHRLSLVGVRLGGSLAVLADRRRAGEIHGLVLWEPIVSGEDYFAATADAHADWLQQITGHRPAPGGPLELLGFPVSDALRTDLRELDLHTAGTPTARRVLILEETTDAGLATWTSAVRDSRGAVELQQAPGTAIGTHPSSLGKIWLPTEPLQRTVAWLGQACA